MLCDEKQLRYGRRIAPNARVVHPNVDPGTPMQAVQNTAYAVYFGQTTRDVVVTGIATAVTTAGGGATSAQVGLFSTPAAPSFNTQTLTKIFASAVTAGLASTGNKMLISGSLAVGRDVHLWGVVRTAMPGAEPTFWSASADCGSGAVVSLAGAPTLTSITNLSGFSIPNTTAVGVAPYLMLRLG